MIRHSLLACTLLAAASGHALAQPQPAPSTPGAQPVTTPAQSIPAQSIPAQSTPAQSTPASTDPAFVLGHTLNDIDGKPVNLADFKGKVVLIVNVASRCGYTGQYEGLEKLYREKKDDGLIILGFPANDFMGQEPGTDDEIKSFCTSKFDVTFPMFSKISVKGDKAHPLYQQLAALPEPAGGEPSWNFNKYLIGRDGRAVQRFGSGVKPSDKQLTAKIDQLLAAK